MIDDFERAVSAEEGAELIVQVKECMCGEEAETTHFVCFHIQVLYHEFIGP